MTKRSGEQWHIFSRDQCCNICGQYCHTRKASFGKFYVRTIFRWDKSLMTSAMSARMSKRVTADSKALAARTMVPRFTDEHGSSANSEEAMRMVSPGRETGRRVGRQEAQGPAILKICGWMIMAFLAKLLWTCSTSVTSSTTAPFKSKALVHMGRCCGQNKVLMSH